MQNFSKNQNSKSIKKIIEDKENNNTNNLSIKKYKHNGLFQNKSGFLDQSNLAISI
jgi:uncharacterized membrane protein